MCQELTYIVVEVSMRREKVDGASRNDGAHEHREAEPKHQGLRSGGVGGGRAAC